MRTAVECRVGEVPVWIFGPHRMLELVLDIEQPHPDCSADDGNRQMYKQERPNADPPHHAGNDKCDRAIGRHGADPGRPAFPHQAKWKPLPQDEKITWTDAEHDDRMTVQAIAEPAPA